VCVALASLLSGLRATGCNFVRTALSMGAGKAGASIEEHIAMTFGQEEAIAPGRHVAVILVCSVLEEVVRKGKRSESATHFQVKSKGLRVKGYGFRV